MTSPKKTIEKSTITSAKLIRGLDAETVKAPDIKAAMQVLFPKLNVEGLTFTQNFESERLWLQQNNQFDRDYKENFEQTASKLAGILVLYMNETAPDSREKAFRTRNIHKKLHGNEVMQAQEMTMTQGLKKTPIAHMLNGTDKNGKAVDGNPFIIEKIGFLANAINKFAAYEDEAKKLQAEDPRSLRFKLDKIQTQAKGVTR